MDDAIKTEKNMADRWIVFVNGKLLRTPVLGNCKSWKTEEQARKAGIKALKVAG